MIRSYVFEQHKILTDLQHGFRLVRSCETQLITTFQDIAEMYGKKGSQIDIAVLDFSKAFDTVPHDVSSSGSGKDWFILRRAHLEHSTEV